MPKTLIIVRHAKSSWSKPSTPDIDRPLAKRGYVDAGLIGNWLRNYCEENDITELRQLLSPSNRTQLTARRIDESLSDSGIEVEQKTVDYLYLADGSELLDCIHSQDDDIECVMLIGHNPGLHALVQHLSGEHIKKFPTAAVACFEAEFDSWKQVGKNIFEHVEMMKPKLLRNGNGG